MQGQPLYTTNMPTHIHTNTHTCTRMCTHMHTNAYMHMYLIFGLKKPQTCFLRDYLGDGATLLNGSQASCQDGHHVLLLCPMQKAQLSEAGLERPLIDPFCSTLPSVSHFQICSFPQYLKLALVASQSRMRFRRATLQTPEDSTGNAFRRLW